MDLFGGIDLGGTFIKTAVVDAAGTIRGRARVPTGVIDGHEAVLERMAEALRSAASDAGGEVIGAGVGVPGLVSDAGTILRFPNFPGWDGFDLYTALHERLALPVVIENDANAAAFAERVAGSGREHPDFVLITLGTGIGGGIVLGGRLFRGPHGKAAEPGHIKIATNGRPCGCGASGCVEQYASATALARDAAAAVNEGRLPPPEAGSDITAEWLHERALAGDAAARDIYHAAARALGIALGAVVNIIDVTVFLIGGGVAGAFDLMDVALRESILYHAFGIDPKDLVLARATCGNDAGMIGAAHLAREAALERRL